METPFDEETDRNHWHAVEEASELMQEERFHEALAVLYSVLKADAHNPYAFFFLGTALYEVKEIEGARDAYRACLRLAPKYLGARTALANVLRELDDPRAAIREGLLALEQSPNDGDAFYAVGMSFVAAGDPLSARRYLRAFLTTKPEFEVGVEVQGILDALDKQAAEESN